MSRGLLDTEVLQDLCKQHGNRTVIISTAQVASLYAGKIEGQLFEIPAGEEGKTREVKELIEDELLKGGYGKDTVIVALGGGCTTDLAGFVASTYLRGVPLIHVPTSLLAMVDAAIGGKTAVNTSHGKNLIGTFYPPKAIVADLATLDTLDEKEINNGLAEILKMGLISDPSILTLAKDRLDIDRMAIKAALAKVAIIEKDPLEKGLRHILNFGHTIGHALEKASHYQMSHGEAVAVGSLAESYLSMHLGHLTYEEWQEISSLYTTVLGTLSLPPSYQREAFLEALTFDKKKRGIEPRCILIEKIGHPIAFDGDYCTPIDREALDETLSFMEKHHG
jgi:3-dehydroquinate synthase